MIPIDETKPIEKEIDGVIYSILPIVGEAELLYYKALNIDAPKNLKEFVAEATKTVDAENPGRDWAKGEREKTIREMAAQLAEKSSPGGTIFDKPESVKAVDALIDKVLIGWKSDTKKLRPFPEHGHPSRCFKLADKTVLFGMISDMNTIEEEERKN